jgi:predicted nucleic acid-binding protein
MRVLLDTNIIIRAAQPSLPVWAEIDKSLSLLVAHQATLCLVPQTLYEFWVVATRPSAQNGFGLDPVEARTLLDATREHFTLLRDEQGILEAWLNLVTRHGVSGKAAHDARIVAAMQCHAITTLVTFNNVDFVRFPIQALTPQSILAGATHLR